MPTYEYVCEKCGYRFERLEPISASPRKRCPKCGGKAKRLLGPGAGVIFKGSGFYAIDYKRKKEPQTKPSEKKTGKNDS